MSELLANAAIAIALLLTGVSLALTVVGLVAYARLRHGRLLWVTVAFAILCGQGVWFAMQAYAGRDDPAIPGLELASLAVVFALYAAVLKR